MRLRRRHLLVAAVLGAAVAIAPALAAGSSAPSEVRLEVAEHCYFAEWSCWNVEGSNPEDIRQIQPFTIAQGGTVSFEDNEARYPTDVLWKGTAPSCTSGVPSTPKTGWKGTCTFANAGEYEFESQDLFNDGTFDYTEYKVIVEGTGGGTTSTTTTTTTTTTAPTTTATTPTTTTTTPATMPATTAPGSTTPTATTSTQPSGGGATTTTTPGSTETSPPQSGGGPVAKLALASAQHGDAVHGTVQIPAADGGARLEIELLAQSASLARAKQRGSSRVGRFVRYSAPAGTVSFTVSLDAQAKSALRRHHKLALTVKIVLTPKHGAAMTLARSVVVR